MSDSPGALAFGLDAIRTRLGRRRSLPRRSSSKEKRLLSLQNGGPGGPLLTAVSGPIAVRLPRSGRGRDTGS